MVYLTAIIAITVLFSVLGDLFESLIKREQGVKDSSSHPAGTWWCPRPYRFFDRRSANIRFKYVSDWLALFMTGCGCFWCNRVDRRVDSFRD